MSSMDDGATPASLFDRVADMMEEISVERDGILPNTTKTWALLLEPGSRVIKYTLPFGHAVDMKLDQEEFDLATHMFEYKGLPGLYDACEKLIPVARARTDVIVKMQQLKASRATLEELKPGDATGRKHRKVVIRE